MAESSTPSCGRWPRARCSKGSRRLGAVLAAVLLAVAARPGQAQIAQGQLLDVETGEPVEGALVLLLDEDGEEAGGYLTNDAGRFIIRAPTAGTYTLQAERIGYETILSDPFQLRQAERFGIRLEAKKTAIELEGIRVEGSQRCLVRPGEGLLVASVWEEARKALTVQDWTEREGSFRFQMVTHERELEWPGEAVQSETREVKSGVSQSPIRSLPAEDLLTEGFVRPSSDDGYDYFGPDASVLLSDLFLDTHCFSLSTDPDRPGEIGLSFEPVERNRMPDIAGTMWLDSETAGLRVLE
ncbi:MAG: carboxypeptidase-like regulatory domain-containing protein, partial [Gemmatimonadota bacterium]